MYLLDIDKKEEANALLREARTVGGIENAVISSQERRSHKPEL